VTIILSGEVPVLYPDGTITKTHIERIVIRKLTDTVSTKATIPELLEPIFPIEVVMENFNGNNVLKLIKGWPPKNQRID